MHNMQKILLLSEARHGSTYFMNEIGSHVTKNKTKDIIRCYEVFNRSHLNPNEQCNQCLDLLGYTGESIFPIRAVNPDLFFNKFMDIVDSKSSINYFIMKVFASQISENKDSPELSLDLLLSRFDKIIILNRNNVEYIFSHANAWWFPSSSNPWDIETRHIKCDDITLDKYMISDYKKTITMKKKYFSEAISYCSKNNKDILYIDYNDLEYMHKLLFDFCGLRIDITETFSKNKYGYTTFLKNNPSVLEII